MDLSTYSTTQVHNLVSKAKHMSTNNQFQTEEKEKLYFLFWIKIATKFKNTSELHDRPRNIKMWSIDAKKDRFSPPPLLSDLLHIFYLLCRLLYASPCCSRLSSWNNNIANQNITDRMNVLLTNVLVAFFHVFSNAQHKRLHQFIKM